uniref:Uncharacterized protein n=1 Tax=Prymnesium polylepis TaxID=72548 RepID=A0A6V4P0D3_9EUKA
MGCQHSSPCDARPPDSRPGTWGPTIARASASVATPDVENCSNLVDKEHSVIDDVDDWIATQKPRSPFRLDIQIDVPCEYKDCDAELSALSASPTRTGQRKASLVAQSKLCQDLAQREKKAERAARCSQAARARLSRVSRASSCRPSAAGDAMGLPEDLSPRAYITTNER